MEKRVQPPDEHAACHMTDIAEHLPTTYGSYGYGPWVLSLPLELSGGCVTVERGLTRLSVVSCQIKAISWDESHCPWDESGRDEG